MQDNGKLCYSCAEVCRILGLSKNSVYAAIARGEIPSLRIGGRILIPRAKLEEMAGLTTNPKEVE